MADNYTASKPSVFDIAKEHKQIDALIRNWSDEKQACEKRREARKKEYNVNEMRTLKQLEPDETYIGRRIIERNIQQEKPEFIAYIEGSPRLVLFKSKSKPADDRVALANWFSDGMKYEGWNEPWQRVFDGSRLHGAAWLEVKADEDKPFHLSLEYTPREDLIFPKKLKKSIQKSERILRRYEYLPHELEAAVKDFGFNKKAVDKILHDRKEEDRDCPAEVYKVFCRKNGLIYISWYSSQSVDIWLKEPTVAYLGEFEVNMEGEVEEVPLKKFPFFEILFEYNEEEEILNIKGRAARDLADQDALSNLWTAMVNGTNRAARLQGSLVNGPNNEGAQTETIEGNKIYTRQVEFFQALYPDPMILQVAQQLGVENLQAAGRPDFAVTNRKDARKTATELSMAQDQANKLSSVHIGPTANTIVAVYRFCWEIVQSQILASLNSNVALLPVPDHIPVEWWTDNYILAPAGDAEVLKRAEKIANMQQDLALFSNTPIYNDVLAKYLELRFPEEAAAWRSKLESTNLLPIVQQLVSVMSAVPTDNLNPQQQQALSAIMNNANAAIAAAGLPGQTQPVAPAGPNPPPDSALNRGNQYVDGQRNVSGGQPRPAGTK